jgi:hypothetical protein
MLLGATPVEHLQPGTLPDPSATHWPTWNPSGFCVPCAESGPTKSYFRSWDPGSACFPLGSFGPAMGSPYAAAFPRPIYAACLGGGNGWAAVGPGEIPDATLSLVVRSRRSMIE